MLFDIGSGENRTRAKIIRIRTLFSFEHQFTSILVEIPVTAEYRVYRTDLGHAPDPIVEIFGAESWFYLLIQRRSIGTSARLPFYQFLEPAFRTDALGYF